MKEKKFLLYKKISEKIFYTLIKIVKLIKLSIVAIKYLLKLFLNQLVSIIKKNIPYQFKIKIKYKLIFYPKVIKFLNFIRVWIEDISSPEKNLFIDYFFSILIRLTFIPILNYIIQNNTLKKITLQLINNLPGLRTNLIQQLSIDASIHNFQQATFQSWKKKNNGLSVCAEKIYNDLKTSLIFQQYN